MNCFSRMRLASNYVQVDLKLVLLTAVALRLNTNGYLIFNKPYKMEVIFRGQNHILKCYQTLKFLIYFEKGFRSFHASNVGSVDQSAAKLLAFKVESVK